MTGLLSVLLTVFRLVLIPVEFQDVKFSCSPDDIQNLANQTRNYLNTELSDYSEFEITITPTVSLENKLSYYGANGTDGKDRYAYKAVIQACQQSASKMDFSVFDNDNDGTIDNVLLLTAGQSESDGSGPEYFWPEHFYLSALNAGISIDGKKVDGFSICPETRNGAFTGYGPLCHEFLHSLNLPDLYDTDGDASGGQTDGAGGANAIMDRGSSNDQGQCPPHLCAIESELLELGTGRVIKEGTNTLKGVDGLNKEYIRVTSADSPEDYYLLEFRKAQGQDRCLEKSGLYIYYIDKSDSLAGYSDYYKKDLTAGQRWNLNQINCCKDNECAALVAILNESETFNNFSFRATGRTATIIDNIRTNGDELTFDASQPIKLGNPICFQDAVILSWTIPEDQGYHTTVSIGVTSSMDTQIQGSQTGVACDGLTPATEYSYRVDLLKNAEIVCSVESHFRTLSYREDAIPYIYLKGSKRSRAGVFEKGTGIPLRIANVPNAQNVVWYFDGQRISVGKDGFYHVTSSGTLKVQYTADDGSTVIMTKEIQVQ